MEKNILVIDDEEAVRETVRLALAYAGYSVFLASNGQEALRVLQQIPRPDVILLDLMMPCSDGWEFVDALQRNHSLASIPVVVVTAFPRLSKPIRAERLLEKPVDLGVLYSVVKEVSARTLNPGT